MQDACLMDLRIRAKRFSMVLRLDFKMIFAQVVDSIIHLNQASITSCSFNNLLSEK